MLKFLALGDSYTIGEGLDPSQNWPSQLVNRLRGKDVLIDQPHIIAQTGWTTAELLAAIEASEVHPPYDLVSVLIGVNNQYRGLPLAEYQSEFERLLQQAISYTHGPERVFVLSIPDWGVTPFAKDRDREQIKREIADFNRANARMAYQYGVQYLNITQIALLARHEPSLLAADQLHYSESMYRRWVTDFLPRIWHVLFPGTDINIPLLYQQEKQR